MSHPIADKCFDAMKKHVTQASVDDIIAWGVFDCTSEILVMAAALKELAETTRWAAEDLRADGFFLRAQETDERAAQYQRSLDALKEIWETS
jgi:hypothetical protein